MTSPVAPTGAGIVVRLHVQPGAAKTELAGRHGDAIKLRVHAPPIDGAANAEVEAFLATVLGVARSAVRLVSGASGRRKRVEIHGIGVTLARSRLGLTDG